MIKVLGESNPKARKRHQCGWCGEWILKGEKHAAQSCVGDGHVYTVRFHDECETAFRAFWKTLEPWQRFDEECWYEEFGMVRGEPISKDDKRETTDGR